jgi:hypothetical protein
MQRSANVNSNATSKTIDNRVQSDAKKARAFQNIDQQFVKHDASKPTHTGSQSAIQKRMIDAESMEALTPNGKVLGLNEFGRPTAMFLYGNDRTTEKEFECDLYMAKVGAEVQCVGAQLLCPKCGAGLYVRGASLPDGHEIVVHWNNMTRSGVDGKYRPLITIDGVIGCDYSDAELSGIKASRSSHVVMRCNWKGGVYRGRCRDHTPQIIKASR